MTPTLPKPTNKQSKLLLQKACNRFALQPPKRAAAEHSCTFCGCPIQRGEEYRTAKVNGFTHDAHDLCFKAVAEAMR